MPDIIDFESEKDRRIDAEIEADQARWKSDSDQLFEIMAESESSDTALVSATLRALLDVLEQSNMDRRSWAKALIARSLKAFQE